MRVEKAVIPALDCEAAIGGLVAACRQEVDEVVVVSDGSVDATAEVAAAAGATVLAQPQNHGKGSALAAGFAYALARGAARVATLDGDGQHDPADLGELLAMSRAQPEALVIGCRRNEPDAMPERSRLGNRASRFWLSFFTDPPSAIDAQSGYRVYPRRLLEEHPPQSRRYGVETELLLRAHRGGRPIIYVPVRTVYGVGPASHFRPVRDTLEVIGVAVRSLGW